MTMKKNITQRKGFAVTELIFGIIGLGSTVFHIWSYGAYNLMQYYPAATTNNISGMNVLSYFTFLANIIVDVFWILHAMGVFGVKSLARITGNPYIISFVTVYILFTGIVYCGLLMWFVELWPWDTPAGITNIIDWWNHIVAPLFAMAFCMFPVSRVRFDRKKALYVLIFPVAYYIFSLVRGGIIDFYPYPFLNAHEAWSYIGGGRPYNAVLAYAVMIAFFIGFCAVFYLLARMVFRIFEKRSEKLEA